LACEARSKRHWSVRSCGRSRSRRRRPGSLQAAVEATELVPPRSSAVVVAMPRPRRRSRVGQGGEKIRLSPQGRVVGRGPREAEIPCCFEVMKRHRPQWPHVDWALAAGALKSPLGPAARRPPARGPSPLFSSSPAASSRTAGPWPEPAGPRETIAPIERTVSREVPSPVCCPVGRRRSL